MSYPKLWWLIVRQIRIYQPGTYHTGQLLELSPDAGLHVAVVLRMTPGDSITLFCGDNREFEASIKSVKKKQVIVLIGKAMEISRESPLTIHLAQAISKGERMELVMQKSVELGVNSITPLITERCAVKLDKERMEKKLRQWQSIVISACEQSGRNSVPVVNQPVSLESYVQAAQCKSRFVLHPEGGKSWRDYTFKDSEIALVIGPEGGLSDEEFKLACKYQFLPLSLGPRILRTETAAISALSVLQAVYGDL